MKLILLSQKLLYAFMTSGMVALSGTGTLNPAGTPGPAPTPAPTADPTAGIQNILQVLRIIEADVLYISSAVAGMALMILGMTLIFTSHGGGPTNRRTEILELMRTVGIGYLIILGADFGTQLLTSIAQTAGIAAKDVQAYEPVQLLQEQLTRLSATPRLATLARHHLQFLHQKLGTNIITRHYIIISASPLEEAVTRVDGKSVSGFSLLFSFLRRKKYDAHTEEQTLRQLRIRLKVVRDGFRDMGLATKLLDDKALARFYASSLTPGVITSGGEQAFDIQGVLNIARA